MKISIFGLGYVGAVTAGCLGRDGHQVVGVDIQQEKADAFNAGMSPIVEPELGELLASARAAGRLSGMTDSAEAIGRTDLSIICVGTPSTASGALDLSQVHHAVREVSMAVRQKGQPHALVLRSTMLPGSTAWLVGELLAEQVADGSLTVYYYPEFLREGTAVADFQQPPLAVVGTIDGKPPSCPVDRWTVRRERRCG